MGLRVNLTPLANNLYFDLGAGGAGTDKITVAAATSVTTNGAAVINLNQLGGAATPITPGTYTLIQGTAAMAASAKFTLATNTAFGQTYTLAVVGNDLQVIIATAAAGPAAVWWAGAGGSNNWGTIANWRTSIADDIATGAAPGYLSNVFFYTTTPVATRLTSNALDVDVDLNSLNFPPEAISTVTIDDIGIKTLTIEATNANGNPAGQGIFVSTPSSGSPAHRIDTNVGLSASQTWWVDSGATFNVVGTIRDFGGGRTLTKDGSGTLTLGGPNTFTGGLLIKQGAVVANVSNVTTVSGAAGPVNNTVILGSVSGGSASLLANSFTVSNPIGLGATAAGTLNLGNNAGATAAVFSGAIDLNGNNLSIVSGGSGSTTLSGGLGGTGNLSIANGTTAITTISTTEVNHVGTITNQGSGTGSTNVTASIGSNVTNVYQNSLTSRLNLSNIANAFGDLYILAGSVSDNSNTASSSGVAANFGAGTIYLGDTSGSNDATIVLNSTTPVTTRTFNNPITVRAGSSGVLRIENGTVNGSQTFAGPVTLYHDLICHAPSNKSLTFSNTITADNSARTITYTGTSTADLLLSGALVVGTAGVTLASTGASTADIFLSGGATGAGPLTLKLDNAGNITISTTAVNVSGTITNSGIGTGTTTISGPIGGNVTGITQASSTSQFNVSGTTTLSASDLTYTSSGTALLNLTSGVTGARNLVFAANSSGNITSATGSLNNGGTITNNGSGSGTITISGVIGANVTGVTQNSATSKLVLSGTNTYIGDTTISAGTVQLGVANAIPGGINKGNVVMNPAGGVTATWDLGGFSDTINGLSNSGAGTSSIDNSTGAGTYTLTVGGNNQGGTFNGTIANSSGTLALTKTGGGTLILGGVNTYAGATTISGGLLRINGSSAAASAVGVSAGALGGTGTINGAVTVSSSGGLDLRDGAVGTLALGSTLNLTGNAGNNNLYFDLGAGGAGTDRITVAAATSVTNNGAAVIHLNQLGGVATPITPGTYTLIQGTTAMAAIAKFSLATTTAFGQSYVLAVVGNDLQLTVSANPAGPVAAWWAGGANPWSTAANWKTTIADNIATGAAPDHQTNVNFVTTTPVAANLTTNTVDVDLDINSLNVAAAATATVTIGGTKTLTIEASTANGNAAGNGITVSTPSSGSPTHTLSAKVGLAAHQTWTVDSGAALTVSGVVNGGYALNKAGSGTLTLSGSNTHTGLTTVSAGTLNIGHANALGGLASGTVVESGAVLQLALQDITVAAEPLTLNGSGISGGGALRDIGGNNETWPGALNLASDATIYATLNSTLFMTGGLTTTTVGDKTLTLTGPGRMTFTTGAIANGGSGQKINIVTSISTVNYNVTFGAGTLATSGDITTTSGGAFISGANNSFTGTWTVRNGAFIAFDNGGIANAAALIMEAGSTLSARFTFTAPAVTKIKGAAAITSGGYTGDSQTYNGRFSDFDGVTPGLLTISHGTFALTTTNTINLGSTAGNDFSGGLTIQNIAANGATARFGTYVAANAVNVLGTGVVTLHASLTGGASGTGYASLILAADQTIAGLSSTIGANNEAAIVANNATVRTLTINGSSTYTFAGTLGSRVNGSTPATDVNIALVKNGAGTQVLTGTNAYTGTTTINGGMLLVNGTLATAAGTVTCNAGGTLSGTGTINRVVIINGTLAPGDANVSAGVGTLNVGADLTLNSGSALAMQLGSSSDQVVVNGNLSLAGDLDVSATAGFAAGTYVLFTYTGTLTSNSLAVRTIPSDLNGTITIDASGSPKQVVLTVHPLLTTLSTPADSAGHTLNKRPALVWMVPYKTGGGNLDFQVTVDGSQVADSTTVWTQFEYLSSGSWTTLAGAGTVPAETAAGNIGNHKVRWRPTGDLTVASHTWSVISVAGGTPGPTSGNRTFTIAAPTWGAALAGGDPIRAVTLTELRTEADLARAFRGLAAATWSDAITPRVTRIRKAHLEDLRTALTAVFAEAGYFQHAGKAILITPASEAGFYSEAIIPNQTLVRSEHFQRIRDALMGF